MITYPVHPQAELVDDAATAKLAPFSETVAPTSTQDSAIHGDTTVGVAPALGSKCVGRVVIE
jgi:hypothetical protein